MNFDGPSVRDPREYVREPVVLEFAKNVMQLERKGIFPLVSACRRGASGPSRVMPLRGVSPISCLLVVSRSDHCFCCNRVEVIVEMRCLACWSPTASAQNLVECNCSSLCLCPTAVCVAFAVSYVRSLFGLCSVNVV